MQRRWRLVMAGGSERKTAGKRVYLDKRNKTKNKTKKKTKKKTQKIRDDVTVLSDSTSRPLDMQNCLSTRPLSRRQRRKSMAAKQPN
jgi:hypothetical protein